MPGDSSNLRAAKTSALSRSQPETSTGACLLVLNIHTGEVRSLTTSQVEPISAFALSAKATQLLWAKADHAVELWDLREAKHLTTLRGHTGKVNAVALSDDGRRAFTSSRDRTLRVWDLANGRALACYTADAALRALSLSPVEPLIAVGDVAGRVHLLRFEDLTT
jgi:WD40 repeat protein